MCLLLLGSLLLVPLDDVDDLLVQAGYLVLKLVIGLSQLGDIGLHFVLLLLRHQCFPHAVGDGGLIECLVGLNCHFDLVTDSNQKEAPLGTVNCDLSNKLVEALGVQLLTDWADTSLSRLSRLKFLVEIVLEVDHIHSGGWSWRNITHPQLTTLGILPWWQDRVQVVLVSCGSRLLQGCEGSLGAFLTLCSLLGVQGSRHQDSGIVLNETLG